MIAAPLVRPSLRTAARPVAALLSHTAVPDTGHNRASSFFVDTSDSVLRRLESLEADVASLRKRVGGLPFQFKVAQYNVLAGYLGDNTKPWFLYGLGDAGGLPPLSDSRRKQIFDAYWARCPVSNELQNPGWPRYVRGILSEEEQRVIESMHSEFFEWNIRKTKIVQTIYLV